GYTFAGLLVEGTRLAGLRGREAAAAVDAALGASGLESAAEARVETFSKGMGRRAALAFASLGDPPLLLLDEPLSGLDPSARALLREAIVRASSKATVLLASHDLTEVKRLADVVFVLSRGRSQRRIESGELDTVDLEEIVLNAERLA